jgi:predicted glycosyltransferase involved in capsule biosynthesis
MTKKLSVIIPFQNRKDHLKGLLPNLTESIKNINSEIIIVEQKNKQCNPALLKNIGAKNSENSDYFCFHDVDMVPCLDTADYSYSEGACHLANQPSQFNYKKPYARYFGGVLIIDKTSFYNANGYGNSFFGWGAEDDDFLKRCEYANVKVTERKCRYECFDHKRDQSLFPKNISIHDQYARNPHKYKEDGINNVHLKYKIIFLNKIKLNDNLKLKLINVEV